MKRTLSALSLLTLSIPSATHARVEGKLLEKGTRKPLVGINIFAVPDSTDLKPNKASTDENGQFNFEQVPTTPFKWVVSTTGYERLEKTEDPSQVPADTTTTRNLYIERANYWTYETTIYDKAQKRDDKTRGITADQISKLAGAGNDPIRAVQNLPGVSRTSGFSSQVIIEGSSPQDTKYQIDGQEVPLVFHFAGLSTVVPPESVERVDLLSSGFGSEYSRTSAGWVSVQLKTPRNDRWHLMGSVDIYNIGAVAEGPVGKNGTLLVSARQSYIGAVLKAALKNNENFNFTVAPDFSDFTTIYKTELTPKISFKLSTVASQDSLKFVLTEPVKSDPSIRGTFSTFTGFFRLIPQVTRELSATTLARFSMGLGKDWIRFDTSSNFFHLTNTQLSTRGEIEHQVNPSWKTWFGWDNVYSWAKVEFELARAYAAGGVSNPFSSALTTQATVSQTTQSFGNYWRNEVKLGNTPWTLVPAVRTDYYNTLKEFIAQPRLQVRYKIDESLTLRSASGLYSQSPLPQEISPEFGNPSLKARRATHFTVGLEKDLRQGGTRGWNMSGDFYLKWLTNIVNPSTAYTFASDGTLTPQNYNNDGKGRALGYAMQARYDYKPWSGWISYTLSRTTLWNSSQSEYLAQYDQTHNLALIGSVELGSNWQLSSRFRYVTGNPTTPISGGTFDTDNDVYLPTRGAYFSERLNPFWQLDFRVDKKWVYNSWILSAYLDIQNLTNHKNIEAIRYSYNYSQATPIEGLPIITILGVKGEF